MRPARYVSPIGAPSGREVMKIVVAGGTGRVGSRVVNALVDHGFEVVVASPSHGVDALTGKGMAEAFEGADVVLDTVNVPPSVSYSRAFDFLETTTRNLLDAGRRAGVGHHVLLSIVGSDRINSQYFRGKEVQEQLVRAHGVPFTVVKSTTFYEVLGGSSNDRPMSASVHVPIVEIQPVAAADLARILAHVIAADPRSGHVEVAGPERMFFDQFVTSFMRATGDTRPVIRDASAEYLGAHFDLGDTSLLPDLQVGELRLDSWLAQVATR